MSNPELLCTVVVFLLVFLLVFRCCFRGGKMARLEDRKKREDLKFPKKRRSPFLIHIYLVCFTAARLTV